MDSHVLSLSVSRRFSVRSPSWSRLRPAKRRGRSKDATFGAPGIATRNQDATFGAPGLTTSNKKLLDTSGCFLDAVVSLKIPGSTDGAYLEHRSQMLLVCVCIQTDLNGASSWRVGEVSFLRSMVNYW